MASPLGRMNKQMKRLDSRKSHSWWWDSHISPKNSKWLAENLEQMDDRVKRMLKLIEEDADSFAKKAQMYYQKRPELLALVEELYRMYRSLAERYDNVTGELKKNMDIQSQGSGISDLSSELPSPEQRPRRQKSRDGSSSTVDDSSSESDDDSSANNYPGDDDDDNDDDDDQGFRLKVAELETELRDVKEKLRMHEEENFGSGNSSQDFLAKIAEYDEELRLAKEKISLSEEEIARLKIEIQKYESSHLLEEELIATKEKLQDSEIEGANTKKELERERREVSKLHDRVVRYKANLSDRGQEIRVLKETVSNANKSLSEENLQLQTEISKLSKEQMYLLDNLKELELRCESSEEEVIRVKAGKLEMEELLGDEIEQLKKNIDELNNKVDGLVAVVSSRDEEIDKMKQHMDQLHMEYMELIGETEGARKMVRELGARVETLEREVERQKVDILEGAEEKREAIRQLCFSLEHYRDGYQQLRQAFVGHKRRVIMAT